MALQTDTQNEKDLALVGSFRRAGTFGPTYVVLAISGDFAEIQFPESDETITLPVQAVWEDPVDD